MKTGRSLFRASLLVLFLIPIAAEAGGFEDFQVLNIRSGSDFHQTDTSVTTATAFVGDDTLNVGNKSRQLDFNHQIAIEISLHSVGTPPTANEYSVQWFFVAKDVNTKNRWVFDSGTKTIPTGNMTVDIASQNLAEHRETDSSASLAGGAIATINSGATNLSAIPVSTSSSSFKSGDKIEGWIVRLKHGNQIEKVDASLSELKDLAEQNPNILDKIAANSAAPNQ